MSNHIAEDVNSIRTEIKRIEDERAENKRQRDPEQATGANLEYIANIWGEKRQGTENDYTLRQRILLKIKGTPA